MKLGMTTRFLAWMAKLIISLFTEIRNRGKGVVCGGGRKEWEFDFRYVEFQIPQGASHVKKSSCRFCGLWVWSLGERSRLEKGMWESSAHRW